MPGHNRRTTWCHASQWTGGAGLVAVAALIGMGTAHADTAAPGVDPNDALVLIPAENQEYADVANALYLQPNGFDGAATVFITPDVGNEVQNVEPGVQALVQTIEADYTAGDLSAADPLYVFGYSAGAVEEGLAEQQLAADGIPAADLNFVMVGDSASAEGGFLNTVIGSLPESLQQPTTQLFAQFGLTPPVLGATTPDNLYPTEVYSLTGDGWPNWDGGANTYGMFTEHLEYLGLTPAEIAAATETTDDMTTYFSIDSANVNSSEALYNQLLLALDIAPSNVSTGAAAVSAATTDPSGLLSDAATNYADSNQLLGELSGSASAYAPAIATQIQFQDGALQDIANVGSAESALSSYDNGVLADVVNPLFTSVDQGWEQASEAALNADKAVESAIATGSSTDIASAFLGIAGPEYQAIGPDLQSAFVDLAAHFLTGGDFTSATDLAAGAGSVSALDPSLFADLLSSIGP
ncbi:PE-PPE domain-containing protein [Mycobacterium sp.]|uniref:PE-PPE domain-containing protein n=1 Tax=Mycobacterium sp. TaxID=1785 RepID=UPI0031E04E0F